MTTRSFSAWPMRSALLPLWFLVQVGCGDSDATTAPGPDAAHDAGSDVEAPDDAAADTQEPSDDAADARADDTTDTIEPTDADGADGGDGTDGSSDVDDTSDGADATDAAEDAVTDTATDTADDALEDATTDTTDDALEDAAADTADDALEDGTTDTTDDALEDAMTDTTDDVTEDATTDVVEPPARTTILPGFCPSTATPAGFYRGTLDSNLNDIGGCGTVTAPGRDGSVRVELEPGQTVRAVYRHDGDGALYLLDSCPVVASCLASSDRSFSGAEEIEWTNDGGVVNPVYVVLDSDSLGGPQTFELDLFITGP